jgi:Jacalin-like lectin domain
MKLLQPRELFGGYDTFTGKNRAPAVTGKASEPTDSKVLFRASVCKTLTEVQKSLTVNGSVSVSYGPVDADAKASYVKDLKITSTSVVVVVYVATVIGTTTFQNVAFNPAHHPTHDTLLDFYTQYGDSFVDSVTLGAEYWATYVFLATSEEQQSQIEGELTGAAKWGTGASIDAHISTAISKVISESQTASTFSQEATGYSGALPGSDEIISFAQKFPSLQKSAPAVVAFTTSGYEHAPESSPSVLKPLTESRERYIDLRDPLSSATLAGRLARVEPLANQADGLADIYGTYFYTADTKLAEFQRLVDQDLTNLGDMALRVAKDPVTSWDIPETKSLSYGVPELSAAIRQGDYWGGSGGGEFRGPGLPHVRERWKLTQLKGQSGQYVYQLSLTWTDPDRITRTQVQGSDSGSNPPLNLAPDEYITSMSARNGTMLDHLSITTSKGQSAGWGGSGGGERTPVAFNPNGKVFLGFYGRSGSRIDAAGVVYAEFSPAIWNKGLLASYDRAEEDQ